MTIVQHIPNFCEFMPRQAEFTDLKSFLEIPFIKAWADDFRIHHHFEIDNSRSVHFILSVSKDRSMWWVVGRVIDPTTDLITMFPKWEPSSKKMENV